MSRPRRDPGRAYSVSMDVLNAELTLDAWEEHWGTEQEALRAWEALKGRLLGNPTTRPAPFWAYEPDVPAEVRGSGTVEDLADPDLEVARLRWLLGPGKHHQRPGEAEALYVEIGRLEDELEELRALRDRYFPQPTENAPER